MKNARTSMAWAVLCACVTSAQAFVYTGPWLQTWDFNNGTQGWNLVQGSGYWVDPASLPDGPTLPDGGVSGGGASNLYCPDGARYQFNLAQPVKSFIVQVDVYVPNLMPLSINTYLPGNGLQNAGVGAISQLENKHRYIAGRNPDGFKMRDHSWDGTDRSRSWLLEEAGVAKEDMWDDWVTLQFAYNWKGSGMYTAAVYTPWDTNVHDGPGWYEFGEYSGHPMESMQYMDRLILGSVVPFSNSWTQAQFDNVRFAPEPASSLLLVLGSLLVVRHRRWA